jgi:hypothetical protein
LSATVLRKNIKSASCAALAAPALDKPDTVLILNDSGPGAPAAARHRPQAAVVITETHR